VGTFPAPSNHASRPDERAADSAGPIIRLRRQASARRPADPASRQSVLAVAYEAKSIAPIGVQLVKDVLRLLNGAGWSARGARRPDLLTHRGVVRAGSHRGPGPAL